MVTNEHASSFVASNKAETDSCYSEQNAYSWDASLIGKRSTQAREPPPDVTPRKPASHLTMWRKAGISRLTFGSWKDEARVKPSAVFLDCQCLSTTMANCWSCRRSGGDADVEIQLLCISCRSIWRGWAPS